MIGKVAVVGESVGASLVFSGAGGACVLKE